MESIDLRHFDSSFDWIDCKFTWIHKFYQLNDIVCGPYQWPSTKVRQTNGIQSLLSFHRAVDDQLGLICMRLLTASVCAQGTNRMNVLNRILYAWWLNGSAIITIFHGLLGACKTCRCERQAYTNALPKNIDKTHIQEPKYRCAYVVYGLDSIQFAFKWHLLDSFIIRAEWSIFDFDQMFFFRLGFFVLGEVKDFDRLREFLNFLAFFV